MSIIAKHPSEYACKSIHTVHNQAMQICIPGLESGVGKGQFEVYRLGWDAEAIFLLRSRRPPYRIDEEEFLTPAPPLTVTIGTLECGQDRNRRFTLPWCEIQGTSPRETKTGESTSEEIAQAPCRKEKPLRTLLRAPPNQFGRDPQASYHKMCIASYHKMCI
ncbi:hypothetical protein VNO77_18692 [Canavalia gladiata]|uniref:Uncharacterized protein n=1 Tax=Canavalia gladiata TaxID=3824 RepID=A0AAN9LR93_CANGL